MHKRIVQWQIMIISPFICNAISLTDPDSPWLSVTGLYSVHINIYYVYPKLHDIKTICGKLTWIQIIYFYVRQFLNSFILDSELFIPRYSIFRKRSGGSLMYIKDNINYYYSNDLELESLESVWLEFKLSNSKPLYTYIPPSSKVEWLDMFSYSLYKLN